MTREKAIRILMNYEFFDKYYFIAKVLRNCYSKDSANVLLMRANAYSWGIDVLDNTLDLIKSKYGNKKAFDEAAKPCFNNLKSFYISCY